MSNYVKATNFTAKDSLPTGNSGKIVKGAEIDTELTAVASAISSKADLNSPSLTGTPTAPTASYGTNTTQIATTAFVQAAIPSGVILLWSGSTSNIPSGWTLCNGSNGTPDLRDRFVVGAGNTYAVGATGGANTNTLSISQLPSHTHSISASGTTSTVDINHTHSGTTGTMNSNTVHNHGVSDPGHTHGVLERNDMFGTNPGSGALTANGGTTGSSFTGISINNANIDHTHNFTTGNMNSNNTHSHTVTVTGTSGSAGSGASIENRPPYYALAYIMRL